MESQAIPGPFAIIALSAAALVYVLGRVIYLLYLSPIAHFPGPKIAAVTHWYGFYYDAICGGQYVWKVEQMHQKYGPVVRINPDEIHISDPDYYAVVYTSGQERRHKVFKHTRQFGAPDSVLGAVHHDLHRMRRAILSPFFSKASVYRLEPVIQDKVDEMIERMEEFRLSRRPLPLFEMFAAYINDVVMEYAFARSDRRLAQPDFDPVFLNALTAASDMCHWVLHMNWMLRMLQSIPVRLARLFNPGSSTSKISPRTKKVKDQIRNIQDGTNRSNEKGLHRTIFHDVLDSDMPASEKKLERMWQEGMVVVGAGTDTTAWTLVVALVHIIIDAGIRQHLEDEVLAAMSDKGSLNLSDLEQLPYLSACIKEALRLSYGLTARLPREAPDRVLEVPGTTGLAIPPGTKVSMDAVLMHRHPQLFPQPDQFRPERWLDNPRLDRYLVSFSKGARQCLGINLAYAELYMALGAVFSRFAVADGGPRLQLLNADASLRAVEIAGDMFLPSTKSGNKYVKAFFS
ncbi:Trichodiene oxygenase [Tolypocladium ophioglossoides CBS 100239]|uniref:Trichodiene oxygenase n=1 Tax=Tolypocladium ophioglossoides (strain CBS 100239) TaxID=1163406 RepID=A0A0L0MZ07_TOLOC|nr:Trichodiene oxygenase [Tolypocladium ophioglossoides CBS 100239]